MPDNLVKSKLEIMEMLGAQVFRVPVVAADDPLHFNNRAKAHAESIENGVWANQFNNLANRESHFETTGPEIWEQLDGKVDGFACGLGSGGTWGGNTAFLKSKNPNLKSFVIEPPGSVVVSYFNSGFKSFVKEGSSFVEGVGAQGRVNDNVMQDIKLADGAFLVQDTESIAMLYRLIDEEGLYLGGSSALNVVAATKVAEKLPEGSNVVTILPDSAHKYSTRFFSKSWLKEKNVWDAIPDNLKKYAALD
ncbi:unnamed protein product [Ambrosiozyma monospora]|uniref:Unnamed protein product n=1 Tax=Ambrosiozyma monospora TaxID=43982 RepID=A0ACB5TJ15_AMBMO|nr:unnamed protein product [Ambrosiozyma monospora]